MKKVLFCIIGLSIIALTQMKLTGLGSKVIVSQIPQKSTEKKLASVPQQLNLNRPRDNPVPISKFSDIPMDEKPTTAGTDQHIYKVETQKKTELIPAEVYEDAATRAKFLRSREMKAVRGWDAYEKMTPEHLYERNIMGQYSGLLDGGKGKIRLLIEGQFTGDRFAGKVAIELRDNQDQIVTQSESSSGELGSVVRQDIENQSILIRVHTQSRYVFQIFQTDSQEGLVGNIYDISPEKGFNLYGSFISERR